jgi:hypothetical protein
MQKFAAGKFHFPPPSRFTSFDHLVGARESMDGTATHGRVVVIAAAALRGLGNSPRL